MRKLVVYVGCFFLLCNQSKGAPGDIDPTFNPTFTGSVGSFALPQSKALIFGYYTNANGTGGHQFARLNSDGSLDPSFIGGFGAFYIFGMATQPDGKILIGGDFNTFHGVAKTNLVRLNSDGSIDSAFQTSVSFTVYQIAVQSDGKILLGGRFSNVNGISRRGIARIHSDGTLDQSFNPVLNSNAEVTAIALQPDGKILLGGVFNTVNSIACGNIARLMPDGELDQNFNPGTGLDGTAYALAIQTDGKVLVGGNFTTINNISRTKIGRLNANGSLDQTFAPVIEGFPPPTIGRIFAQNSGRIIIAGTFATVNSTSRKGLARLNSDGSLDETFIPGIDPLYQPFKVSPLSNGKLLVSGSIKNRQSGVQIPIARLMGDPVALGMQRVHDGVVLNWPDAAYRLQSASSLDSEFLDIPEATSPFTNAQSVGQRFFRLFAD